MNLGIIHLIPVTLRLALAVMLAVDCPNRIVTLSILVAKKMLIRRDNYG